jgi:branched-chain amino acid transport system substrate-binding protein
MESCRLHLPVVLAFGATLWGCSLVLDFGTSQCSTTADCRARGPAFRDTVCSRGSCERPDAASAEPDASTAATDGSLATSNVADLTGDAGASDAAASGCTSTAQCVLDNLDEPYVCAQPGHPCLPLKSAECPLVFGDFRNENAQIFGAFLNVPASAPLSQMSTLNVQLAVDEFNGSVGGLPGGPLGKLRPLVAVVCRNDTDLVANGARHLVEDLGVPAVLAHLPSADLKTFFVDHALPHEVFVINPGFADNSLTALDSQGLFWHVIGDIRDVAPPYAPLMARIEAFVNPAPDGGNPPAMRVAMVVAQRYAEQSIADAITPLLQYNGRSISDNANAGLFFPISVPALADEPNADYSVANQQLLDFRPQVVIALTREEFVYQILPALEGQWSAAAGSQPRPFYVLPTALSGNLDLLSYVGQDSDGATSENKRQRFVGVAPASAEDLTLYDQFMLRFRAAYPRFQNPGGFENFYDALYLLANAMYAAGSVPTLLGPDVARGMLRIVTGNTVVDVGPTHIADGFTALATGGTIRLNGTMGLADFDPGLGARRGNGSVYCIARSSSPLSFAYDVLRYDKSTHGLVGTFPCYAGF